MFLMLLFGAAVVVLLIFLLEGVELHLVEFGPFPKLLCDVCMRVSKEAAVREQMRLHAKKLNAPVVAAVRERNAITSKKIKCSTGVS